MPASEDLKNTHMNQPVLNQINLVVGDMAASIAFYRRLGLTVHESALPEWVRHHATLMMPGGIRLELDSVDFAKQWAPGWNASGGASCVLMFGVTSREDVDQIFGVMAAAGYAIQKSPEDAFWGARYAIIEDPDGNPVGIMSPIDPARRHMPPPPPA